MLSVDDIASGIKIIECEPNSYDNMDWLFANCMLLQSLKMINFDTSNTYSMIGMFQCCKKMKYLDISSFDFSNTINIAYMFKLCKSLTNLKFGKGLKKSIDLTACPLTHTSALSVINGLSKVKEKQTITFSKITYDILTKDDKEIAENKKWIINRTYGD